jgi:hypothetical protein
MDKEKYTLTTLLNDIQEAAIDVNEGEVDERAIRDYQDKLIIMQMLIRCASIYSGKEYENEEKLKNAIDVVLKGDEQLSGYMFFVSQNQQFNYTWSYMRKRRDRFGEYLAEAIRFLNNVVEDINLLANMPREGEEMHVVFGDLIDVDLLVGTPSVRSSVLWKNLYRVAAVKSVYNVSVKMNENVLVAGIRKECTDMRKLMDMVLEMINKSKTKAKLVP